MTTRTAPRGWRSRSAYPDPLGNYQMTCGHYAEAGVYACVDCNTAPLSDKIALRDALIEALDALESQVVMDKQTVRAANKARAALALIGEEPQ